MALSLPVGGRRLLTCFFAVAALAGAEPLSKRTDLDFFAEVPSRDLKGLATRSDGRLVAGPSLSELRGPSPADLLWTIAPAGEPDRWLLGTGPDAKIFEVTVDRGALTYSTREIIKLEGSHVFALKRLPDGSILAGTSPGSAISLINDGELVARIPLPADSIFDILLLDGRTALVATGNPGRIYRVSLSEFAAAGVITERITDKAELESHGITLFGEIRDRNVRRLARFPDGRVVAGSAPRGNIYVFPELGGAPSILQENRDAEVTDLLVQPNGDLYAALTFTAQASEMRMAPPQKPTKDEAEALFTSTFSGGERFSGRASVIWIPWNGFPETLTSRGNTAVYGLARQQDTLLIAGGEQGELLGFDLAQRLSLTFAGSPSSQLNGIAADPNHAGSFLVLHNNAPGFALLDFNTRVARTAETRRLDLGGPARIGALRFDRLRHLEPGQLSVEIRTSNGSDAVEGWSAWTALRHHDGGWALPDLRGRFVRFRFSLPASATEAQLDKAALFSLPQNRRPQLQDFRVLSPNFAIVPPSDSPMPFTTTLGQLMQGSRERDADRRRSALLSSAVLPSPGMQAVFWTAGDPDGDTLVTSFSIRRDGEDSWTDLVVDTPESFVQFDTSHLPDGVYLSRLVIRETDPRPASERLEATFETDNLVVDHTPPTLIDTTAERREAHLVVTVRGRDALSLLEAAELTFNNGHRVQSEQPADGIRDSREETFVFEIPLARVSNATSVEVTLYDAAGNAVSRRLKL